MLITVRLLFPFWLLRSSCDSSSDDELTSCELGFCWWVLGSIWKSIRSYLLLVIIVSSTLYVVRSLHVNPRVLKYIIILWHCHFPSVLWHCWLIDRKGIRLVKNWMLVHWWWWFDWSFARPIAPVVTTTSIILCYTEPRFTWKMAVKMKREILWHCQLGD